ncbi:uncharacterized protein [Pyrus communis]|uniref:uncharacterized protein n=1 Tax=Pyrus communis TaxID=23211 RepID=UPI0035BF1A7A
MLVHLRPTATQPHSLLQLVTGYELDVLHLQVFGCAIYVPIASPLRTKMSPQRKMGIYVGYDSPSIVCYLEPLTGNLFTTRFADCHFDETVFPSLRGDKHANVPVEHRELSWYAPTMSHLNPRTAQSETEEGQTVPEGGEAAPSTRQGTLAANQSSAPTLKRGRPLDLKDSQPLKRKMAPTGDPSLNLTIVHSSVLTHEFILDYGDASEETCQPPENHEILVHYAVLDEVWNKNDRIIDDAFGSRPQHTLLIKLKRSLYGLEQSEQMWYYRLSEYLTSQGYVNNELSPCMFIKKSHSGFVIVAVYVDDMNLIGTPANLKEIAAHLKSKFEMNDLGKTRYFLSLEIEHCSDEILVRQSNYTQKVLRCFNEDKVKPSSTPMVIRTLDAKQDPFRPKEDEEKIWEPEVPYLSVIRALLYLAQCSRPDISFIINLLARY